MISVNAAVDAQGIFKDVPETIDKKADYLFYLHGRIIEEQGIRPTSPKYGVYEYEKILEALKNEGFIVISEARPKRTAVNQYALKIISQVQKLLQSGVPAANITVVGASKGAIIAMRVSSVLRHKDINFVFMAGCNDNIFHRMDTDFHGYILSLYDHKDEIAGTCSKFKEKSPNISEYKELVVKVGTGHGILYQPLKEWIKPVTEWARHRRLPEN